MDNLRLPNSAVVSARDINSTILKLPAPPIRCKANEDVVQQLYDQVVSRGADVVGIDL